MPRSEAAASLVEAYLGGNSGLCAPLQPRGVRLPPVHVCSPRSQVNRSSSCPNTQHSAVITCMLQGNWAPTVPRRGSRSTSSACNSRRNASDKEAQSRSLVKKDEAQASVHRAPPVEEPSNGYKIGDSASQCGSVRSFSEPGKGTVRLKMGTLGKESAVGRSRCIKGASDVSHATTPSWRSRSFPPSTPGEALPVPRQRLPPLPDEARWWSCLKNNQVMLSEVKYFNDIDSAVVETNAMLVESFLNVKSQQLEEGRLSPSASCSGAGSGPLIGAVGSETGRRNNRVLEAVPEMDVRYC